jgi:hypothetical protein
MHQQVDEHLKDLAPERDRRSGVIQLTALGVQAIVAKEVTHAPALLLALAFLQSYVSLEVASRNPARVRLRRSPAHHSTKIPRKFHENSPNVSYLPAWKDVPLERV